MGFGTDLASVVPNAAFAVPLPASAVLFSRGSLWNVSVCIRCRFPPEVLSGNKIFFVISYSQWPGMKIFQTRSVLRTFKIVNIFNISDWKFSIFSALSVRNLLQFELEIFWNLSRKFSKFSAVLSAFLLILPPPPLLLNNSFATPPLRIFFLQNVSSG